MTASSDLFETVRRSAAQHHRAPSSETCPLCGYSLRGLPPEHRCPECGFAYDRHTHVWRAPRFWRFAGLELALLALLWCGWIIRAQWAARLPLPPNFWFATAIIVGWSLLFARRLAVFYAGPFVATTPAGVMMRIRSTSVRQIPWDRILRVEIRQGAARKFARLVVAPDRRKINVSGVLQDDGAAEQFVRDVRKRLCRGQLLGLT